MATAKNSKWGRYLNNTKSFTSQSFGNVWKGLFRANVVRHTEPGKHEEANHLEQKYQIQRFKNMI